MDAYSQLRQVRQSLEKITQELAELENDLLQTLQENTELKVENQLLHDKLDKIGHEADKTVNSGSGLQSLRKIYDSGYHICNMYYGTHRNLNEDCIFCIDLLDNFAAKKGTGHADSK